MKIDVLVHWFVVCFVALIGIINLIGATLDTGAPVANRLLAAFLAAGCGAAVYFIRCHYLLYDY